MKPVIHQNPKLLGLDRQFGHIKFGVFSGTRIFEQFISIHFGTAVGHFSTFFINQPLLLQKTKTFYPNPQKINWDWDWNLNLSQKELGISHRVSIVRG